MISIKLQRNFIKIILQHGSSPVNLPHIFRTPFPFTSERLLLYVSHPLPFVGILLFQFVLTVKPLAFFLKFKKRTRELRIKLYPSCLIQVIYKCIYFFTSVLMFLYICLKWFSHYVLAYQFTRNTKVFRFLND